MRGSEPFFLWLGYNAPHTANRRFQHTQGGGGPCRGRMPQPPTLAAYRRSLGVPRPTPPAFNEPEISDKPRQIRSLPRLSRSQRELTRRRWHCTLATMKKVDKDLNKILETLREEDELSNTIIVYLSDNGYFFGEHRLANGKGFPYEEALSVPFVIRVPRALTSTPSVVHEVVSNQDIAPTPLDYAKRRPVCGARQLPASRTVTAWSRCSVGRGSGPWAAAPWSRSTPRRGPNAPVRTGR